MYDVFQLMIIFKEGLLKYQKQQFETNETGRENTMLVGKIRQYA